MVLDWIHSLCYGLIAGLTEIFPVGAQAHRALLLKLYGVGYGMELTDLFVDLGILAGLYISSRSFLLRMARARALARIPKRRRRRPLDERSLMDFSLLRTMCLPVLLSLLLYGQASKLNNRLLVITLLLLLNGLLLYIPQFLPGSNRDSRTLSRLEGLLMGLGGSLGVLPGMSAIGGAVSVGSMCGVEKSYGLSMALMMDLFMRAGLMVYDVLAMSGLKAGMVSFGSLLQGLVTGLVAFGGSLLAIRVLRRITAEFGNNLFALYCMGLALFIFVLNLMA